MNIQAMMKQAKKMQEEVEKKKEQLSKQEFTVEKQGVTVIIYGSGEIKSININEALIDPDDKELLEDLMIIAINEAITLVKEAEEELMPSPTPGMPI